MVALGLRCSRQSHRGGFSCCRAQALGREDSVVVANGPILNVFFYFCKFTLGTVTEHFWARFPWIPCCQTHQTPSSLNRICPLWEHFILPTSPPWRSVCNGNMVAQVLLPHAGKAEAFWQRMDFVGYSQSPMTWEWVMLRRNLLQRLGISSRFYYNFGVCKFPHSFYQFCPPSSTKRWPFLRLEGQENGWRQFAAWSLISEGGGGDGVGGAWMNVSERSWASSSVARGQNSEILTSVFWRPHGEKQTFSSFHAW